MRYSEPYSYRGYKLDLAERHGAAGAIFYSNPEDDGALRGPVSPDGPWGNASHIQWGAVIYDWLGPGQPFTFHWTERADGAWEVHQDRLGTPAAIARMASIVASALRSLDAD